MKVDFGLRYSASLSFLILSAISARAQTITVDTASDVTDFGGAQQVANLPGPDGKVSLAEAGLASDNTPGVQTIAFHVPQSEWTYQWLYPGRAVLQPFLGFRVFDTVVLDATTQTAFTGDTNPAGGEVVIWAQTYLVNNIGSTLRGFDNTQISVSGGSANVIQGNTQSSIDVYDSAFTVVGGANPGEGNTGGTIKIDRSSNNVVIGNTVQRVRVLGWIAGGQPAANVRIGGPSLGERNYITGYGTWSEGCPGGTTVQIFDSIGVVVENNWIGTTPDGMSQGSLASTAGVGFEGENYNTIIRNNRIAGILGHGTGPHCVGWLVGAAISVYGTGSGISIVGNAIGLNANNEPLLGSVTGIETSNYYLGPIQNVVIGGSGPGDANEIAGHLGAGVSVSNTYAGVRVAGNSIHDNGGLGIDLITNGFLTGVTPNDPLDVDTGGNGLQNFPVIQSLTSTATTLRIVGTLNSSVSSSFAIEFFASPQADASGFGEGEVYLGSTNLSTNASGNATFDVTLPVSVAQGWFVSSTATNTASGSTSEFSASLGVGNGGVAIYCTAKINSQGCVPQIGSNGTLSLGDGSPFVIAAANVRNAKNGLLFYGASGRAASPFLGGTLCMQPPIRRTTVQNSGGSPPSTPDCSGTYSFDFDAWFASGKDPGLGLGDVVDAQYWSRDPASSSGVGLTDALEFTVTP